MKKAQEETYDQIVNILDQIESLIDIISHKNILVTKEIKLEYIVVLEGFLVEFIDVCSPRPQE